MKIKRGNIVQIDWDNFEKSLNKRLEEHKNHISI